MWNAPGPHGAPWHSYVRVPLACVHDVLPHFVPLTMLAQRPTVQRWCMQAPLVLSSKAYMVDNYMWVVLRQRPRPSRLVDKSQHQRAAKGWAINTAAIIGLGTVPDYRHANPWMAAISLWRPRSHGVEVRVAARDGQHVAAVFVGPRVTGAKEGGVLVRLLPTTLAFCWRATAHRPQQHP